MTYEFRTKSAQSGGWRKTAGDRQFRISAVVSQSGGLLAKARLIGDLCGLESQRRWLDADAMAEREELGSNILHVGGCRYLIRGRWG